VSRVTWISVAGDDEQSHLGFFAAVSRVTWISVAAWMSRVTWFFTAGEQEYLGFSLVMSRVTWFLYCW
jgi:hypothetical protein